MLRMEIALFLVLAFVAYIYFSAEKRSGISLIFLQIITSAFVLY